MVLTLAILRLILGTCNNVITLIVTYLSKVFTEVTAEVDKFYTDNIPRARKKELCALMKNKFGHEFTKDGTRLSGSLEQLCNAMIFITQAIDLADQADDASMAAKRASVGVQRQTSSEQIPIEKTSGRYSIVF